MRQISIVPTLLFLLIAQGSCGSEPAAEAPDAAVDNFDRAGLLQNIGENILLPTYENFSDRSSELLIAVGEYCESLGLPAEAERRAAAQAAWKLAMSAWQQAEVMQIGPVTDDGNNLHDLVYSWPVVSACAVDQEVMALYLNPESFDISQSLSNRRGLDAKEYALFATDLASICPPQVAPEGWAELSEAEKRAARCAFVEVAAADLEAHANSIRDGWNADGGNFLDELLMAGMSGSRFASEQDALNALFGALFYIDTVTKDQKLAEPTGLLTNSCGVLDASCPQELESQHAGYSKDNIAANLDAFGMVFFGDAENGTEGQGFDDYLVARGREDIATKIKSAWVAAGEAIDAIPGSAGAALESDYTSMIEAHTAVKAVTDSLKQDVPSILNLEIPTEAGGDND